MTGLNKSYSVLMTIPTFEERLCYLQTHSKVGGDIFGSYRYLVEQFLQGQPWKKFKRDIIVRDDACDLACPERRIPERIKDSNGKYKSRANLIIIHHINPCTLDDYLNYNTEKLLNPENVITTTFNTHQQIHYGNRHIVAEVYRERKPGDTCPWR